MAKHSPRMLSLTLTASGTVYQLLTLLAAADTNFNTNPTISAQNKAMYVSIQNDVGSGSAKVRMGNSDVSATNCGIVLVAGQALQLSGGDSNTIALNDIYLVADTNTTVVNVVIGTR